MATEACKAAEGKRAFFDKKEPHDKLVIDLIDGHVVTIMF